jgi:hypothetical protein
MENVNAIRYYKSPMQNMFEVFGTHVKSFGEKMRESTTDLRNKASKLVRSAFESKINKALVGLAVLGLSTLPNIDRLQFKQL